MATHAPHASQARRSFYTHDDQDEDLTEEQRHRRTLLHRIFTFIKIFIFLVVWAFFTVLLIITPPHETHEIVVPLEPQKTQEIVIDESPTGDAISIELRGFIDVDLTNNPDRKENSPIVIITVENFDTKANESQWQSNDWHVYLKLNSNQITTVKKYMKVETADSKRSSWLRSFHIKRDDSDNQLLVSFLNTHSEPAAVAVTVNPNPINLDKGVIFSFLLLVFLYVLIIFDITDRTFAAMLSATLAIGILSIMGARPSLEKIISWIDFHTLMLLFGMMIMVSVLAETGVFDYLSVTAYRISKGQPWFLIFLLCMLTVILSAFLDNVTIVMLMVPVVIRLSECMGLRTTTVLICVAIFSNIGGTLTPVGDPPNVIIATNPFVIAEGVNFLTFVMHMFPGVFLSICAAWIYLYFMLNKRLYTGSEDQMRESLKTLAKHAAKITAPTPSEEQLRRDILKRIEELKEVYRRKQEANSFGLQPAGNFIETLAEMESKYKIRNKPLLIKCCIALGFAIALFSLHSIPFMRGVTLSWAAMLAAVLLLILANKPDMDVILSQIEWSTLLFFASLFVLIEAVCEMGLIEWVGEKTIGIVLSVQKEQRVIVGIMLMMWISAIFSAFVDNIPIVTMMLKLAIKLAGNEDLELPLLPLIWALSFGVCFGGNGTLIAASSNVVAAGIASQHGYTITFNEFFKYGFPVMLLTDVIASLYLLVAHGLFKWH